MAFVLPSRAKVGYLDPEIAGEGSKVILSDGEQVNWNPPPPKPCIPDWSQIKSIQRYFHKTGYEVYPAWLFHPTEEPRLVKNEDEAAGLGVCYRKRTEAERMRFGAGDVWDYAEDSQWRAFPYRAAKFDPEKPGHGKTYIPRPPNPEIAQNQLVAAMIPAVVAAVMQTIKGGGTQADPKQWEEFLKFQAWKQSQAAVNALAEESKTLDSTETDVEWAEWEERAKQKNIKVDRRWSLARLKEKVEKAA